MEGRVLSHGDGVWSSIPWGLRSLCKMLYVLQLSISHIIFNLAPINHHWWACFFWSVARTNAHKWLLAFMPVSYLDLLDKISSCWFITACVWCRMYASWWNCLVIKRDFIIILSQHKPKSMNSKGASLHTTRLLVWVKSVSPWGYTLFEIAPKGPSVLVNNTMSSACSHASIC